jgi:hypothetical protein
VTPRNAADRVAASLNKPRRRHVIAVGLAGALLTTVAMAAPATEHRIGMFAPGALADWEHKSFKGKTQYRLVGQGATRALEATCDATASAIARRTSVDLSKTPILRWQWRVDHIYAGLDGTTKGGDDYAARVYVIHDGGLLPWRTRAINYVWANSQPRGHHWPNAFTDKAMMVAVQSGPPADPTRWISESRNVREDFKRYYGLDLEQLDGVALMTDCDNSGRKGRAYYRDIRFTSK